MQQDEKTICPHCQSGDLERIKRPTIIKLIFGNLLKRRYQCMNCRRRTYHPKKKMATAGSY